MGGIGNQMFQYALGRRLAIKHNTNLKLDLSWYANQTKRDYLLDHFQVNAQIASPREVETITRSTRRDLFSIFSRRYQRLLPYHHRHVILEKKSGFDPHILKASSNSYLFGYWQSEEYFKPIEHTIRKEFRLLEDLHPLNQSYLDKILSSRAVSIHIRRGDYLDSEISQVYHHCGMEYYQKAMDLIQHDCPNSLFFVFSDDLEWVQQNLAFGEDICFVDNNQLCRDWETVYLMSQCKHNIIANSSFSWWGAWLNRDPKKIVVAPQKWFTSPNNSRAQMVPQKWIQI